MPPPQDSLCNASTRHRIVIAGDTLIRKRFAAIAWGWSLESDCVDSTAFADFIKAHYAQGPENFCSNGTDFSGGGFCNAPLEVERGISGAESGPGAEGSGRVLWRGSLARRGKLIVETVSLDGKILGRYDLGEAGPGPAQAAWGDSGIRKGSSAAGAAVYRVKFETAGGIRMLSESIAYK